MEGLLAQRIKTADKGRLASHQEGFQADDGYYCKPVIYPVDCYGKILFAFFISFLSRMELLMRFQDFVLAV